MKTIAILAGILFVVGLLVACDTADSSESLDETAGLGEDYADALSIPLQLALGSLRLEDTDLTIDERQAAELVPLWQAYQSLSASDKAAEAEIGAVLKQIESTMSPEQIDAILAMALTYEDLDNSLQELAGQFGRGGLGVPREEGDVPGEGGFGGLPGEGVPGSGFPGGGGGMGRGMGAGLGEAGVAARATRIAEMGGDAEEVMATLLNEAAVNMLIRQLQIKTGELDASVLGPGRMNSQVLNVISETTGIPVETLQQETASGATLTEAIAAQGGDLEEVEAALKEAFAESGRAGDELDQRIDSLLNNEDWQTPAEE